MTPSPIFGDEIGVDSRACGGSGGAWGEDRRGEIADVASDWMAAYLRGVRDYHAAIIKKGPGQADVVSILTHWTPVTDASVYPQLGFAYIDPNGQLNLDSLADQLRFAREQGQVTAPLDVRQTVDMRFADAAVQTLGHLDA